MIIQNQSDHQNTSCTDDDIAHAIALGSGNKVMEDGQFPDWDRSLVLEEN